MGFFIELWMLFVQYKDTLGISFCCARIYNRLQLIVAICLEFYVQTTTKIDYLQSKKYDLKKLLNDFIEWTLRALPL